MSCDVCRVLFVVLLCVVCWSGVVFVVCCVSFVVCDVLLIVSC